MRRRKKPKNQILSNLRRLRRLGVRLGLGSEFRILPYATFLKSQGLLSIFFNFLFSVSPRGRKVALVLEYWLRRSV